jgi:WW domain-binding protein 2
VDTPWFGPNTWSALVQPVPGGNIPPEHPALELKITFKDGGAFDFSNIFERMKERVAQAVEVARESGREQRDVADLQLHLDELPAYQAEPPRGSASGIAGNTITGVPQQQTGIPARQPTPPPNNETIHGQPPLGPPPGLVNPQPDNFVPPAEPPPGYEEVQRGSVADELERRLREET